MTTIIVKTQFEGIHKYENAPEAVKYLRDPHRHIFGVEVEIEVFHDDRELEFIMVKHELDSYLKEAVPSIDVKTSCEQYAKYIIDFIKYRYGKRKVNCFVNEDGENGAKVYDI